MEILRICCTPAPNCAVGHHRKNCNPRLRKRRGEGGGVFAKLIKMRADLWMLPGNWGALSVDFSCLGKRAGISSGYAVCSRLAPRRALDFGILTLMAIV